MVFQFKKKIRYFDFEEDSFIININNNLLHKVSGSAALILANINGKNNLNKIIELIKKKNNISEKDIATYIKDFITTLKRRGFIEDITIKQ